MTRLYDISPLIDPDLAVWPGDTPCSFRDLLRLEEGAGVHLSTLTLSCHTGAHADAPGHCVAGAPGIDEAPLERYLGPCLVRDIRAKDHAIHLGDLDTQALEKELKTAPRILFRTRETTDRSVFPDPFTCLTPEVVDWLGACGVVLIGLDSPSVDRFDSKDLPCHRALHRHGIANLESLQLDGVPAGRYELIALPLKLAGRDASPVRAILRA